MGEQESLEFDLTFGDVLQQYRSVFFESNAQAKMLGRDVNLFAVEKYKGQVTKLGREGVLPWCEQR